MLVDQLATPLLRAIAVCLFGAGGALVLLAFVRARWSELTSYLAEHRQKLAHSLMFLRWPVRAERIVLAQGLLLAVVVALLTLGHHVSASVLFTLALAPRPLLQNRSLKRITAIETQLDGWLYGLASNLRATPALGEAIASSATLVQVPLRDELDLMLKEHKLGTSMDEALARMALRIGSRTMQTALAALRIGQRTGGQLPDILERSAQALREMARLEGVVRTKTAEGKAQAYVVGVIPFPLVALLHYIDPGFLNPLVISMRGHLVIAAALVLWLLSIVVARKVLRVDI
jgi:tight adherence protein B